MLFGALRCTRVIACSLPYFIHSCHAESQGVKRQNIVVALEACQVKILR
jgi:hypothetical protein